MKFFFLAPITVDERKTDFVLVGVKDKKKAKKRKKHRYR